MKNIIHVIGDSEFGGGSKVIIQLVKDQVSQGNQVKVLTTNEKFKLILSKLNVQTIDLKCIKRGYNIFFDVVGICRLIKFLRSNNFDVVHTHTSKAGLVGRLAAFVSGSKNILHTVHGFPFSENSSYFAIKLLSFMELLLARISTKVIFVSHYHLCWAVQLGIINKKDVGIAIPNGVPDIFTPTDKIKNSTFPKRIVYVGRLVAEKGIYDLLEAFENIKSEGEAIELLYIGDGPEKNNLLTRCSDSLDIKVLGFKSNVPSLLYKSDIFVLPSYREGLSISAIEAQCLGLASILSDVGGNREISSNGSAALLFNVGNVADLTGQLRKILLDQSMQDSLKHTARENYLANYTEQKMLEGYRKLYNELLTINKEAV